MTSSSQTVDVNGARARPQAGDGAQAPAAVHRRRHPRCRRLRRHRGDGRLEVGGIVWLPFLVAFAVATLTALSYLELVTKYPQAAGAALYTHKAFGVHFVTFLVAFAVVCSGHHQRLDLVEPAGHQPARRLRRQRHRRRRRATRRSR